MAEEPKLAQLSHASQDFSLPKDALCSRSEWFKSALQENRFQEGITKTIELHEDLPAVFELFVFFIYFETLIYDLADDQHDDPSTRKDELILCANLWIFSDKYLLPDLQDCSMLRICRLFNDSYFGNCIPNQALATLFSMVRDDCPIRVAVADYVVDRLEKKDPNLQVCPELASCPGFYQALHDSEAALHSIPRPDFPRYCKPPKFAQLFHTGKSDEDKGLLDKYSVYTGSWNRSIVVWQECHDCACRTSDWVSRCKTCDKSKCTCMPKHRKVICRNCS